MAMFPVSKFLSALLPMFIVYLVNSILYLFTTIYLRFPIDVVFHILGGVFTARAAWIFVFSSKKITGVPRWFLFFVLLGAVAIVGILWEVYEFLHDAWWGTTFQPSQGDTMSDLMMDLVGAVMFIGFMFLKKK